MFSRRQRIAARQSRPVPRRTRRRLFEPLEDRRFLACDVFVDDQTRTLFVQGDDGDNRIAVRAEAVETVGIHCDGVTTRLKLTHIGEVQVKAGGGNDTVIGEPIPRIAVHYWGEDGDDSMGYHNPDHHIDVNDDGIVQPADSLAGGGGRDHITLTARGIPELVKVDGVGDQDFPDPEIKSLDAAGNLLSHLFIQETEAITLNTSGGNDRVELHDRLGLLAGIGWSINTGRGDDSVLLDLAFPDQTQPPTGAGSGGSETGLLPAVLPAYDIDIASGRGDDHVDLEYENPLADLHLDVRLGRGDDHFSANVVPGSGANPAGVINPCMDIDVTGGSGDDTIALSAGSLNANPSDGSGASPVLAATTPADLELEVGLDGGDGRDTMSVMLQKVRVAPSAVAVKGGQGNDDITMAVDAAIADLGNLDIYLDGGPGRDIARITQKVRAMAKIVHFEQVAVIP